MADFMSLAKKLEVDPNKKEEVQKELKDDKSSPQPVYLKQVEL